MGWGELLRCNVEGRYHLRWKTNGMTNKKRHRKRDNLGGQNLKITINLFGYQYKSQFKNSIYFNHLFKNKFHFP